MQLEKLTLFDFKNYEEARFTFNGKVNCFLGKNGSGKTNVLDAIHYLGLTKSAVNNVDSQNITHGKKQFLVRGDFLLRDLTSEVECSFVLGARKTIRVGGRELGKLSEHIGNFPMVLVAPYDIELVWGNSEQRRKFFDSLLSQIDKQYLENLIAYNHQLKQRNSALRFFDEKGVDLDLLDTYNQKLKVTGTYIHNRRIEFLKGFLPVFIQHYGFLSGQSGEVVDIVYQSDCHGNDYEVMLRNSLRKDLALQRTCVGVHRDDFLFVLNGHELKRVGSQGQQKSFLIGLKLAEFQSIELNKKSKPLLLLDDIFDKLDDERIHKLITLVADGTFGQLFITDARPDRSQRLLLEAAIEAEVFHINEGKLLEVQ